MFLNTSGVWSCVDHSTEMSEMAYSTNQETDDQGSDLPGYVPYLSLVFRLVAATMVNLLQAGWVIFTIKTTRSLHKAHNIFLTNLLIAGTIFTLSDTLITSTMMISYQLGVESPISCYPLKLRIM